MRICAEEPVTVVALHLVVDRRLLSGEALPLPDGVNGALDITPGHPHLRLGGSSGITLAWGESGTTVSSLAEHARFLRLRERCTAELTLDAGELSFSLRHLCTSH